MWFRKKKIEIKMSPIHKTDGDIIVFNFGKDTPYEELIKCMKQLNNAYRKAGMFIPAVFARNLIGIFSINKKEDLK